MKSLLTAALAALILHLSGCKQAPTFETYDFEEQTFTKEEIDADFQQLTSFLSSTHPQLDYTTDLTELDIVSDQIVRNITEGMSPREVWWLFATLNPIFNDAHVGLKAPTGAYETYKSAGGPTLPFTVEIEGDKIFLTEGLTATAAEYDGSEIQAINGVDAANIIQDLRPKMRGESIDLSNYVMSRRFETFYWARYGGFISHSIKVQDSDGVSETVLLDGLSNESTSADKKQATNLFDYKQLENNIGLLTINTFDIQYKEEFAEFLEASFSDIFQGEISELIIDIRKNGGGAKDLSDPLLSYLTTDRYTSTSKITARIVEENISRVPGTKLGDVVTVPFPQWVTPEVREQIFDGKVYVMISERTYSQSIAFSTVIQDFQIGTVVGEETAGRANQTGQVKPITLSNTALTAYSPIYIFYRAKPREEERGLTPDVPMAQDVLNSSKMLNELIDLINKGEVPNS